jgi:hypothetical protein
LVLEQAVLRRHRGVPVPRIAGEGYVLFSQEMEMVWFDGFNDVFKEDKEK